MKTILKWLGIVLGVLLGLVLIVLAVNYFKGNTALSTSYSIAPENLAIPTDAASLAHGKHIVQAICGECHTDNLSGKLLLDASFAKIYSANLTPGKGGAGTEFADADWVRALRHGVDNKGRALVVMPAEQFWNLNDQDLGDIVAYLKTLPAVDNEQPDPQINAVGRIMIGAGIFGPAMVPAAVIAHNKRPAVVPVRVTADYGNYLISFTGCRSCHGAQLAGGKSGKPGALAAPNLTPGGELSGWTTADFIQTIRTGVTPGGHHLNPEEMPWNYVRNYSDDELTAIFMYLQSLPQLATVKP